MGRLFRVELPIASRTVDAVEQFVDRASERADKAKVSLVLIFEFQPSEDRSEFSQQTEFAIALRLARLLSGERFGTIHSVAYIPEAISGHAVLAAMACNEIMMGPEAQFGPVGADPGTVLGSEREAYREIAQSQRTIPDELAVWLLDSTYEVLRVETEDGRRYVTNEGLEALRETVAIVPDSVQPLSELVAGDGHQFTGEEARQLHFVSYLPSAREDMAKDLELPPSDLQEDPSLVDQWRAVRVDLRGEISSSMVKQAIRMTEEARRVHQANFICLWIDSPGGSPTDSIKLAGYLGGLDSDKIRTVAYISSEARADAALIALACDEVVMSAEAVLGGWEQQQPQRPPAPHAEGKVDRQGRVLSDSDIEYVWESIFSEDSPWIGKPRKLIAAMIAPEKELRRYTRLGEVAFFFDDEIQAQQQEAGNQKWQEVELIVAQGQTLSVGGDRAVEYGLAVATVESLAEFQHRYDLDKMVVMQPGWAAFLIDALAQPGVAAILLLVAFMALYTEAHTPGLGIGGFVATVCFLVFFWVNYLGGTAEWLEVLLFLAGVAFVALEIFVVPGFGVFGLGGGCLILTSLVLASQTFILPQDRWELRELRNSLLTVASAGFGIVVGGIVLRRWLPNVPFLNRLILSPPQGELAENLNRREALIDLEGFVGMQGTTTTQLTPSGKARFGDDRLDVMTDGEVVPRGAPVEVVEVHGNRLVVKFVDRP